jgi:tetratricopeptide (TPR) repeat protein
MKNQYAALAAVAFAVLAAAAWADAASTGAPEAPAPQAPPPKGLEPIFPADNPDVVFTEAEDAVSTNFAREPVLNYGVSGFRALQLNRGTGLEGVGSFYADYVLTLPTSGTWELWYGGTPPGPKDETVASYTSPLSVTLDAREPRRVWRENVAVVENYAPAFYWNLAGDLTLDAGRHVVRFEVTEKRRIDGRYFFYLDCFFLVKKEDGKRKLGDPLPAVFPVNMDARNIDTPFSAIDDLLIGIRDNPGDPKRLVNISRVYTLLGDYLNALKYLNRASLLQPKDPEILLLLAKNRIWKGDTAEGLKRYRDLLAGDPKRRELWLEAGKVAAWNGSYDESIGFFHDALAVFPRDLDLTINLGLTYLWAGRGQEAENTFRTAQGIAGADPQRLKAMGRVYRVNGYPDRAAQAYAAAVSTRPQDLESHLLLIDALASMGKKAEADAAKKRIADTLAASPRLTSYLESFQQKEGLKHQLLEEYNEKLRQNPDNLVLRQVLAQSYFWNGMKARAVAEYRHILTNHAYLALQEMEARSFRIPRAIDRGYLLIDYYSRVPGMARRSRDTLASQAARIAQAISTWSTARAAAESARQAQARAKPGKETEAAQQAVRIAEDRLLSAESALTRENDALSGLVDAATVFISNFDRVKLSFGEDLDSQSELVKQDADAEAALAQTTRATRWRFAPSDILGELAQDLRENDLARIVAAKIYLSDRLVAQAQALLSPDSGSRASTSAAYTLAECYLWGGKTREAATLLGRLSDDPGSALLPTYFRELGAYVKSLEEETGVPGADAAPSVDAAPSAGASAARSPADTVMAAKVASGTLAGLEKDASAQQEIVRKSLALLHTLYRHSVGRAFHAFDQQVVAIRNELGDYYLAGDPPALDPAITQFRHVLAVEPGDMDATFRLGKVYEWKRDWKSAMDSYHAVYQTDPYFENVAPLYNHLARDHADTLATLASEYGDTQRVQSHLEAVWSHSFDSTFGLAVGYQNDDMRIQLANGSGGYDRSAYSVHDASLGVPIDLYLANAKLTPWVGGLLAGNGLFQNTDAASAAVTPPSDFFQVYSARPYMKLDASFGALNVFSLNGTARWGPQPETLDPARGGVLFDASAEANLVTRLSFIDSWPLRDTSLRTYGRIDLIHTGSLAYQNLMYTALQEVTVNLLKGGSPYGVLSVTGGVTWQNSDHLEAYIYYTPNGIFMAGGSLTGSMWIGTGNGDVLGLSLRGYAGSYQQNAFTPGAIYEVKAEGEADVSLTTGNATWTLTILGNGTYNLGLAAGGLPPWDFWSLFVRLGYSLKLPVLLSP